MKAFYLFFLFSLLILPFTNAQVFWQDDFGGTTPEMGGGTRLSSVGDPTDGTCCGFDRFVRSQDLIDGSCCGCNSTWSNLSGVWAWSGEDLDGTAPCSNATQTITWSGINITGRTNLEFIGLFGCRGDTSWEGFDQLKIEYRIDGGALVEGFCFSPELIPDDLGLDVDCDYNVDGDILSTILSEHSFSIPATGLIMEIIFTANVNAAGEEFVVDNFRLNEGATVAVKLSEFKATLKDKSSLLEWQTESEENNDYFQIEHSTDGRGFKALDQVQGNGNSSIRLDYSFIHRYPNSGVNYYRLKQVDYDGAFAYSDIKAIEVQNDKLISIYPNPFYQAVTVQFPSSEYKSSVALRTIQVFDIYGKLVLSKEFSWDQTIITLDLSELHSGAYFMHTLEGQFLQTSIQRIIKL